MARRLPDSSDEEDEKNEIDSSDGGGCRAGCLLPSRPLLRLIIQLFASRRSQVTKASAWAMQGKVRQARQGSVDEEHLKRLSDEDLKDFRRLFDHFFYHFAGGGLDDGRRRRRVGPRRLALI